MDSLITVSGLYHRFGRQRVLNGVDLTLKSGQCAVLFGSNGCGKSTLLALLSTRYRVQKGEYHLSGLSAKEEGDSVRGALVFVGHHTHLYGHLTPLENARFFCDLRGLKKTESELRQSVVDVGLERFCRQPCRWFSAGMKKRLALSRILLAKPSVLLLDEPYSALDQQGVLWLNTLLTTYLQEGGGVVMASHDPERVSALNHRPHRFQKGRLQEES